MGHLAANLNLRVFTQSGPISDMGSQCLGPIGCPLSLAAPLQSARLQTWGRTTRRFT
jgi:hypothetical protein